jgi:integrase
VKEALRLTASIDDRDPALRPSERDALAVLAKHSSRWPSDYHRRRAAHDVLQRLLTPLHDVCRLTSSRSPRIMSLRERFFIALMHERQTTYWTWTRDEWLHAASQRSTYRYEVFVAAYVLGNYRDLDAEVPGFRRRVFARAVLGRDAVEAAIARVSTQLRQCGYGGRETGSWRMAHAVCGLLLRAGSAQLEDVPAEVIQRMYEREAPRQRHGLRMVVLALRSAGVLHSSPISEHANAHGRAQHAATDVPNVWLEWCRRWCDTSTLTVAVRQGYYYTLLKVGRWLATQHPGCTSPTTWSRDLALAWVAAVDRMVVGDWAYAPKTRSYVSRLGQPLSARSKAGEITAIRTFFRDLQEWDWVPRRFDPGRVLVTPRSVRALIGPDPRCIPDDIWAKLLWAGLNLTAADVPEFGSSGASWYAFDMVRAVALLWLFAGLRANEIARLRVGCIRWQGDNDAICFLDVPVHKTGTAFTKPVDPVVGRAIAAWEAIRPAQPPLIDSKTGEAVQLLFARKGQHMSRSYINRALIPMLCRKANVPTHDARGALTSHRARSTIASQLYNAKEPMTLFELQAWLGHKSPSSTQHYARITPTTLAKAYHDAGYFARNVRAIEVLVDRDSVTSGEAATGQPWQYVDLGHGYCTYNFFEQCPHRMACARCDFYVPKDSSRAQLLEAKEHLQHMLVNIPLTEDEQAAVDNDVDAVDRLLERLATVPTPAGPTPRELRIPPLAVTLPVIQGNAVGATPDGRDSI